jgi:hypothetical protein
LTVGTVVQGERTEVERRCANVEDQMEAGPSLQRLCIPHDGRHDLWENSRVRVGAFDASGLFNGFERGVQCDGTVAERQQPTRTCHDLKAFNGGSVVVSSRRNTQIQRPSDPVATVAESLSFEEPSSSLTKSKGDERSGPSDPFLRCDRRCSLVTRIVQQVKLEMSSCFLPALRGGYAKRATLAYLNHNRQQVPRNAMTTLSEVHEDDAAPQLVGRLDGGLDARRSEVEAEDEIGDRTFGVLTELQEIVR